MNRFQRWLALRLISRKINKMERAAVKRILAMPYPDKRTITLHQALSDEPAYTQLRHLRHNLLTINNPWGDVFSFWSVKSDGKHADAFEPFVPDVPELEPLPQNAQVWIDMPVDEFLEVLDAEEKNVTSF